MELAHVAIMKNEEQRSSGSGMCVTETKVRDTGSFLDEALAVATMDIISSVQACLEKWSTGGELDW